MNTNNEALFMGLSFTELITIVGVILTVIGILTAIAAPIYLYIKKERKESLKLALNDNKGRQELVESLKSNSRLASFQGYLGQWNDWLNSFFGQSLWKVQAFDRCLQIALLYPIALFFLAWALGGSGSLSGIPLLPDGYEWWQRLLSLVALLGWVIICYGYFKNFVKISAWFGEILRNR